MTYANTDSPPPSEAISVKPRIDHAAHTKKLQHIAAYLNLAAQARAKAAYCTEQYESHSFLSSPFVSKSKWEDDARKWSYISYRLERYYFKLLCALNSDAYKSITE